MSNRNRPQVFRYSQNDYDLTHTSGQLRTAFTEHVPEGINILLLMTCHCFTFEGDRHSADYVAENEYRCFCPTRYSWSLNLPDIIVNALHRCTSTHVYHSKDKNGATQLLLLDELNGLPPGERYFIFFQLTKSNKSYADLKMTISSAYAKSDGAPRDKAKLATELDRAMNKLPRRKTKRRRKK